MSEQLNQQQLEQYVDWVSLEYYDKRIKQYIDARCVEDLKIGGDKSSSWFSVPPTVDNLNRLYRAMDEFTTSDTFEDQGIVCGSNSIVYADNTVSGIKYKLLVNTKSIDDEVKKLVTTLGLDVSELQVRLDELTASHELLKKSLESATTEYRNSEALVSAKLESLTNDITRLSDDVEDAETRISEVVADLRATEHSIHDQLHSHEQRLNSLDTNFATKAELEELENKLDNIPTTDLNGYATEAYVQEQVAKIPTVDLTGYATEESVDQKIADLVGSAPSRLNTIDELASALEEHEDTLDAIEDLVKDKVDRSELSSVATSGSYNDLKDTPVIPSTEGLASEEFVNEAIASIPPTDLTEYAKKSEIPDVSQFITSEDLPDVPTKVSEFENDAGYLTEHQSLAGLATEEFVQQKIDSIPSVDLSGYAKKSDIPDTSNFLTEIPSEYVTETELESKGYLTEHQDLSEYAKKSDIPTVPTKVSELENDVGYLTEHQSLEGLATKAELESKADKTYVDEAVENVSVDLTGYATEDFVKTEIANAQLSDGEETIIDLSYLATKNELAETEERLTDMLNSNNSIEYGTF